ncbi:MAG: type II secretion system F family protein [Nanoarchaeota archaeon]
MEIKKINIIGMGVFLILIITSFFFYGTKFFIFLAGFALLALASPFVFTMVEESRINNEKEEMFLEFARDLVESVKTGTSISKSIINIKKRQYGLLTENINKLANQIYLGVPLTSALKVFSRDVNNKSISRAITLIGQAERAGGNIGEILEAVAEAVTLSDKLKKERKAVISSLVVQGYIIFFVFMIIVLIMQLKILPMLSGIGGVSDVSSSVGFGGGGVGADQQDLANSFLYLLLAQGFFSGLTIGKLSEGSLKSGIKHSFALMLISFLISSSASLI